MDRYTKRICRGYNRIFVLVYIHLPVEWTDEMCINFGICPCTFLLFSFMKNYVIFWILLGVPWHYRNRITFSLDKYWIYFCIHSSEIYKIWMNEPNLYLICLEVVTFLYKYLKCFAIAFLILDAFFGLFCHLSRMIFLFPKL